MHKVGALIGGEGNGGIIFPAIHCGRDAMVGTALFLSALARKGETVSQWKRALPQYAIVKKRIELSDPALIDRILSAMKAHYAAQRINDIDGVKIDFEASRRWVHLRRSNTEPIIRIYAEAPTEAEAEALASEVVALAQTIIA
jgi:phosphomannomutase